MTGQGRHWVHSARVATVAMAVVIASYVVCAFALNLFVVHRLTAEVDGRIATRLSALAHLDEGSSPYSVPRGAEHSGDLDDVPVFLWRVGVHGSATALAVGEPALPRREWTETSFTLTLEGTPFRLAARRTASGWIVAGQSVIDIDRVRATLLGPEAVFGLLLAVVTFAGALVVGLRASAPLDLIRRRQAIFTADASHELRTPLSVVEAEVDLALRQRRAPDEYEVVLRRVADEGRRLRRIVDDLMWLARADDAAPELEDYDRADVVSIVAACTDRFRARAAQRAMNLSFHSDVESALVHARPEWIDRLAGVLVDNACKYAGSGGNAEVWVRATSSHVSLRVQDSGPGIPREERDAIFDRFHRATSAGSGSGLGLAIAESVVRMTGGTWSVGDGPLGGASVEVSWRRASERPSHS